MYWQQQDLRAIFAKVGPLDSIWVKQFFERGSQQAYAFVNYVFKEDADRAVEELDGMSLEQGTFFMTVCY